MESTVINWLNTVAPGLGVALAIIVVGGGFIIAFNKSARDFFKKHDRKVRKEQRDSIDDAEFKQQMLELMSGVKEIRTNMIAIDKKVDDLSETIRTVEKTSKESDDELRKRLDSTEEQFCSLHEKQDIISGNVQLLIESDKESNRSFITLEYYKAIEKGYIEVYTMQAIEYRYEKYLQEHGDSFINGLIKELRELKHEPCEK